MSNWLLVIILEKYVAELTIWNIFDYMPPNRELSTPPILLPVVCIIFKIYRSNHLSHTAELSTCIDLYNKVKEVYGKLKILKTFQVGLSLQNFTFISNYHNSIQSNIQ